MLKCITPLACGHYADNSFCLITFKVNTSIADDERRTFGHGLNVKFDFLSIKHSGHDITSAFAQSLSDFIGNLLMVTGGTLLIWGHRVNGQG